MRSLYLWRAAYCFGEEGTAEAEAWVTERLLEILRGKSSDVAAGIRRSATLRGLEPGARDAMLLGRLVANRARPLEESFARLERRRQARRDPRGAGTRTTSAR